MGACAGSYYLLDAVNARMTFTQTVAATKRQTNKWGFYTALLIEGKANGDAIVDQLETDGVKRIITVQPGSYGKVTRAHAVTGLLETKSVFFPAVEQPWWEEYLRQMLSFPAGKYDDLVDSSTQVLSYMSGQNVATLMAALSNIQSFNKNTGKKWRR